MKTSSMFALVLLVGGVNVLHQKPSKANDLVNMWITSGKPLSDEAARLMQIDNIAGSGNYWAAFSYYNDLSLKKNLELIQGENDRIDGHVVDINGNKSGILTNASNITTNASGISSNDTDISTNASGISSNDTDISSNASGISSNDTDISTNVSSISSNDTDISKNASGISSNDTEISSLQSLVKSSGSEVQIGSNSDGVTISSSAVRVGGENLIRKASDGSVHIGENSLVLKESGGRQQMWATDANGDSIDIDVVNGSRLLINGRDVEKSIDNVGALSAALGSVPTVSADSQFTCGFGGGTHSSAYAFSGGCASRVSDRVSVNAALATVVNNQTGDADDNLSARAGFTFRLGKIDDSPKVAARKAAALHDEVAALRDQNASIKAASIEQQQLNLALMARLERLEAIALGQNPAITTASLK